MSHENELTMVCFDVRFETFSFINIDGDMVKFIDRPFFLLSYKGKLGVTGGNAIYRPYFQLWVLEDAEKHKWSKQGFKLQWPHRLLDEESRVSVAGMIGSEDIVLSPTHARDPFFIYYYNLERKMFTRVRVQVPGVDESKLCRVYTFPNFVEEEEVKLI
ncbi:unnamed protein product [Microthlaspi erraticum]|uniref:F-box associated beta-propeller type 3 domain-containing protein n=1 Tax=Microthlaspi erraticum TaxID=1685480 RepID=A0A6D2HVG7_9BRAS|nr:unnamed protein product [Microthlaspi erraticum]